MAPYETHAVEIAGLKRELRLFEIKPGLRIAILNILGDTELVQAASKELAQKLKDIEFDLLVTAEAKSIPLAYALSVETKKPYVVLRKTYKP
jgi:adenine phosphoribosyltransferase